MMIRVNDMEKKEYNSSYISILKGWDIILLTNKE